jgi:hypothetical protein
MNEDPNDSIEESWTNGNLMDNDIGNASGPLSGFGNDSFDNFNDWSSNSWE